MKHATTILAAILLSALLPACGNDDSGAQPVAPPARRQRPRLRHPERPPVATSAQASRPDDAAVAALPTTPLRAPSYRYDVTTGALRVTHANAALRGTGAGTSVPVSVRVRIEENIITVLERQPAEADGALGLHDISFEITNLPVRAYRVVVIEPWVEKTQRPLSPHGSRRIARRGERRAQPVTVGRHRVPLTEPREHMPAVPARRPWRRKRRPSQWAPFRV